MDLTIRSSSPTRPPPLTVQRSEGEDQSQDDDETILLPMSTQSPPWLGTCPRCGGPAVYALVAGKVVGACNALTVPCYRSDDGEKAEAAAGATSGLG